MDWGELGTQIAKIGLPLLGAVLPIPGGVAIGTALASHIGAATNTPDDILAKLTQSADAVEKAHEFELTHQETMLKLKLEDEQRRIDAEVKDRDRASNMYVATKSFTPEFLSWIIVIASIALYAHLMTNGNPKTLDDVILGRILGTLDTSFGVVLAFWLGTSYSSRGKDATIANIAKGQ
jgi:hypothetical protein